MWIQECHWHFDYVRLAWDAGFSFERCKFPDLEKNKICLVDVDRVVRERDIATVERHIPTVIQFILENDQVQVLDSNFVKMFRISQLSVEYLLFCKQYLDNTVVLLKKEINKLKEENKELKLFNEELQNHINALKKCENVATFSCNYCTKVFSSDEYLNVHIKRRHTPNSNHFVQINDHSNETEMLQMEIKELKERLNIAEKQLKEKNGKEKCLELKEIDENEIKLHDVQAKFDIFRKDIEEKLNILKIQNTFYEENYGKLFDIIQKGNNSRLVNTSKTECHDQRKVITKTTQTECNNYEELDTFQGKHHLESRGCGDSPKNNISEIFPENKKISEMNSKICEFEENISSKVSLCLQNLEDQMQILWDKINTLSVTILKTDVETVQNKKNEKPKPLIKPRSVFTQSSSLREGEYQNTLCKSEDEKNTKKITFEKIKQTETIHEGVDSNNSDVLKPLPDKEPSAHFPTSRTKSPESSQSGSNSHQPEVVEQKSDANISKSPNNKLSIIGSHSSAENSQNKKKNNLLKVYEAQYDVTPDNHYLTGFSNSGERDKVCGGQIDELRRKSDVKSSTQIIGNNSTYSLKNMIKDKQIEQKLKEALKIVIDSRLEEMGISSNWKELPKKSYERALEIIRHQAKLANKNNASFEDVKTSLENSIRKYATAEMRKNKCNIERIWLMEKEPKIVNVRYKIRKPSPIKRNTTSKVTINKSFYESDTEDDLNKPLEPVKTNLGFSQVICELQDKINKVNENHDNGYSQMNIDLTKGDLKNATSTSVGSITKKKVVFNVESNSVAHDNKNTGVEIHETTASEVSSILEEKLSSKAEEGISDLDLSYL